MSGPVLLYNADGQALLVRRPMGFARAVETEAWKTDETLTAVDGQLVGAACPFDSLASRKKHAR